MQRFDHKSGDTSQDSLTQTVPSDGSEQKTHGSTLGSWSHMIAGATGGMATAILTSPLDVLRTRLQSDFYQSQVIPKREYQLRPSFLRSSLLHFRETFEILFAIHRVEGLRGLFKGLGPSLTGVVPASAVKFYTYGNCKRLVPEIIGCEKDATLVHVISAATASIATGTATNPIWLVKTRLQLDRSRNGGAPQYKNSMDCIRKVLQQEGPKGLYRGLTASYLGAIETTLHLTLYERIKGIISRRMNLEGETESSQIIQGLALSGAAGASKLLACLIAYPHEVIRTRLRQAPMADGRQKYTGILQCARLMLKEEGMLAMYGGLTAHLLRTVPSAAITLGAYELVLKLLDGH